MLAQAGTLFLPTKHSLPQGLFAIMRRRNSDRMNVVEALFLAIFFFVAAWGGQPQTASNPASPPAAKQTAYDGRWWASADHDRRSGFFWGAGDCLSWTAHVGKEFFGSSGDVTDKAFDEEVSKYYRQHPEERAVAVIEVWRKVARQMEKDTPQTPGGEVYTNPHGFLNGLWYRGSSQSEGFGFLEGYLGCLRNYVSRPTASYSRSVSYYDDKLRNYIAADPKADDEAIANIFYRFRDKPKPN
jgi:hypothetical protein